MTISVPVLGHSTKIRRKTDQQGKNVTVTEKKNKRTREQLNKENITTENTKAQRNA